METKKPTLVIYIKTWVSLLVLLAATIFAAQFSLGSIGLPIALMISITQALLVLLFFMHLHYSKAEMVIVACAAYLWLGIMLVGMMHDYLSRNWIPQLPPEPSSENQKRLTPQPK